MVKKNIDSKKEKQHFISNFYLQQWRKNNVIYCCNLPNQKWFQLKNDTTSVASVRDCYKVEITDNIYKLLLYKYKDTILEGAFKEKGDFNLLWMVVQYYNKNPCYQNDELAKYIDCLSSNFIEDKYAKVESGIAQQFKKLNEINSLTNNISSIINRIVDINSKLILYARDNDFIFSILAWFITQSVRTPLSRKNINTYIKDIFIQDNKLNESEKETFIKLISFYESIKFFLEIDKKGFSLVFYINLTELDFITSDNPIINNRDQNNELNFSAPINPRIWCNVTFLGNRKNRRDMYIKYIFHENEINNLNKLILENNSRVIFSTSRKR